MALANKHTTMHQSNTLPAYLARKPRRKTMKVQPNYILEYFVVGLMLGFILSQVV